MRETIATAIAPGFAEIMDWGMISWVVPRERQPDTYNGKPLLYCSLAAQKRHSALYLMNVYAGSPFLDQLTAGYEAAGIKLTMGKSCVRFKNLDTIHLPTIAAVIAACDVDGWLRVYTEARAGGRGSC